jgi:hypothetical protein
MEVPAAAPAADMSRDELWAMINERVLGRLSRITDLNCPWTREEIAKRIARYILTAAMSTPEVQSVSWQVTWQDYVKSFVAAALSSYGSSCQEFPWFYELDLGYIFGNVAWKLLQASSGVDWESVCNFANEEFHSQMGDKRLHHGMWLAVSRVFEHPLDRNAYRAVLEGYNHALFHVRAEAQPWDSVRMTEVFIVEWVGKTLARVWSSTTLEHALTEEFACALFKKLLAPFGEEVPYSCLPDMIGQARPWVFLFMRCAVRVMFIQRRNQPFSPECDVHSATPKRRRCNQPAEPQAPPPPPPRGPPPGM